MRYTSSSNSVSTIVSLPRGSTTQALGTMSGIASRSAALMFAKYKAGAPRVKVRPVFRRLVCLVFSAMGSVDAISSMSAIRIVHGVSGISSIGVISAIRLVNRSSDTSGIRIIPGVSGFRVSSETSGDRGMSAITVSNGVRPTRSWYQYSNCRDECGSWQ